MIFFDRKCKIECKNELRRSYISLIQMNRNVNQDAKVILDILVYIKFYTVQDNANIKTS